MLGPFVLKEIGELNFLINRTTQRPPSSNSGWKVEFWGPFGEKYIHCSSTDNLSPPTKGRKMKASACKFDQGQRSIASLSSFMIIKRETL
jgi:hypothetical protein